MLNKRSQKLTMNHHFAVILTLDAAEKKELLGIKRALSKDRSQQDVGGLTRKQALVHLNFRT